MFTDALSRLCRPTEQLGLCGNDLEHGASNKADTGKIKRSTLEVSLGSVPSLQSPA